LNELKEKAITGVFWNSAGTIMQYAIEFSVGILLARLLTPDEFGLVGMVTIVVALSQVFVNSGFNQALVRKPDCSQVDFSTAFYFNMTVGIVFFLILFVSAKPISLFFNHAELEVLIRVLGIVVIIGALTIVQQAKLLRRIDFKLQTKITVTASIISGIVAVLMAINGFGVWSLIAKTLINQGITSALLWYHNRWYPDLIFSMVSFRKLFGFGSNLLLSGLIGTIYNNIYYATIAKYFSARDLGFFTRAEMFKNIPSQTAGRIITAVGYPVLAKVQDNQVALNSVFRQILTTTFFIVSLLMCGTAAIADSMVITLIGEQWRPSIIYLQMLCFIGLVYPLNTININLLNVVGRSDLYLKLQLITQLLGIPVIFLGLLFGIKIMILGMCLNYAGAFFYYSKVASRFSGYKIRNQLSDILPSLVLALTMGFAVYLFDYFANFTPFSTLILQIALGILIVVSLSELLKLKEYLFIKGIIFDQLGKLRTRND
jgi:teichuronic acid exporter